MFDLSTFTETGYIKYIFPLLTCTSATQSRQQSDDNWFNPIKTG